MREPFRRRVNRAQPQPLINYRPKYREIHVIPWICLGLLVSLFVYISQGVIRSMVTKLHKRDANWTEVLVDAVLVGFFFWGYLKLLFICEEWCRRNRNERRNRRDARRAANRR